MVEDAACVTALGRAGDLAALHQDVVAAGGLRVQAQAPQRRHHRLGEAADADAVVAYVGDEGVVQVAQVVIDRAAAGAAAHHVDMVLLHKGAVDLRLGVLVAAYYDGVVVLPQQQVVALGAVTQDVFLECQVVIGVLGVGLQIVDGLFHGRASDRWIS